MRSTVFVNLIALLLCTFPPTIEASKLRARSSQLEEESSSYPDFLKQQSSRFLQDEADGQKLGQRCGRNTECSAELACTRSTFSRRCMPPKDCLQERLAEFEAKYGDMEDYKAMVLGNAGTSQQELIQQVQRSSLEGNYDSSTFPSVIDSMNQIMPEPILEMRAIFKECGVSMLANSTENTQDVPPVEYVGYHVEAGLGLAGSFSYIQAKTAKGYQQNYVRYCFGVELGGGAEFSFLFGQYPEGTNVIDLQGGSIYAGLDLGLVWHIGAGGGQSFDNLGFFEIAPGVGAGASVGSSVCWALFSNWNGVPPFPLPPNLP